MMKINKDVVDKIKQITQKTIEVSFDIDGEQYIVNVATFLSLEMKDKLIAELGILQKTMPYMLECICK